MCMIIELLAKGKGRRCEYHYKGIHDRSESFGQGECSNAYMNVNIGALQEVNRPLATQTYCMGLG